MTVKHGTFRERSILNKRNVNAYCEVKGLRSLWINNFLKNAVSLVFVSLRLE